MTEQLTYLERYVGSCLCYLQTVSDCEAELESRGVLVVNVFATKQGTWSVKWLWPSVLPTSMAACVGGWISSKRPHSLPDRAGVSSGNSSHRHGWIKIEELPVEREKATGEWPPRETLGFLSWSPAFKAEKILYLQLLSKESLERGSYFQTSVENGRRGRGLVWVLEMVFCCLWPFSQRTWTAWRQLCNLSACFCGFCHSSLPYACTGLAINYGALTHENQAVIWIYLNWMWIILIYMNRLSGITVQVICSLCFGLYLYSCGLSLQPFVVTI